MRPIRYPTLDLDSEYCEVKVSADHTQWVDDVEMTQLESDNLSEVGGNCFELNVDKPLVGYRYLIHWEVKTVEGEPDLVSFGRARQLRETLLRMVDGSATDKLNKALALGQKMFDEAFEHVLFPTFRSAYHSEESLVAALFVLDETKSPPVLQLVLESATGPAIGGNAKTIPINEGVAGTAFKKRHLSVYASPELVGGDNKGAYVYYPGDLPPENERFSVLAAVPVYLSDDGSQRDVTPDEMIGVFTLGSNAKDSGLLRLIEPSNDEGTPEDSSGEPVPGSNTAQEQTKGDDVYLIWTLALQFMQGLATTISDGGIENPQP